jgi:hypothetical protein
MGPVPGPRGGVLPRGHFADFCCVGHIRAPAFSHSRTSCVSVWIVSFVLATAQCFRS